jgi:hypothetical protein
MDRFLAGAAQIAVQEIAVVRVGESGGGTEVPADSSLPHFFT